MVFDSQSAKKKRGKRVFLVSGKRPSVNTDREKNIAKKAVIHCKKKAEDLSAKALSIGVEQITGRRL